MAGVGTPVLSQVLAVGTLVPSVPQDSPPPLARTGIPLARTGIPPPPPPVRTGSAICGMALAQEDFLVLRISVHQKNVHSGLISTVSSFLRMEMENGYR